MIYFDINAIDYIKKTIFISNTPAFLYNRIAKTEYTQELCIKYSAAELVNELAAICNKAVHDSFDLAASYYLIIALLRHDDFSIDLIADINMDWIEWSGDIISFYVSDKPSTNIVKIELKSFHVSNNTNNNKSIVATDCNYNFDLTEKIYEI